MKRLSGNWFRKWDDQEIVARVFPKLEEAVLDNGYEFDYHGAVIQAINNVAEYNGRSYHYLNRGLVPKDAEVEEEMKIDLTEDRARLIAKMEQFRINLFSGSGATYNFYSHGLWLPYTKTNALDFAAIYLSPQVGHQSRVLFSPIYVQKKEEFILKARDTSKLVVEFAGDKKLGEELKRIYRRER